MMKKPIMILCVDRDNDVFEKGGISGPLIGRKKNLEGATRLALADPEDSDSNTIFCAIKMYDEIRKDGQDAEVVTLTGDKRLGYTADKLISSQLDRLVIEYSPSSCIVVTDGASDEAVLPIIRSRLKIDSIKIVFIKQAKELEKTYFVILEKLKDPYYAKIILGIPGLLILIFSLARYYGLGFEIIGIVIGAYLILRTFMIEEMIFRVLKDFKFSFEKTSWVGFIGAFAMFLIGIFSSVQSYNKGILNGLENEKLVAAVVGNFIWIFYLGLLFILLAKSVDALIDRRKYDITRYAYYATGGALATFVLMMGVQWVVNISPPYVDFGTFLLSIAVAILVGQLISVLINWYRKIVVGELKLEGKEAIYESGTYLGKIAGIDLRKGSIIVQTVFDKKLHLPISSIRSIEDNVVLKDE